MDRAMVTCSLRRRALYEVHISVTSSKSEKGQWNYLVISHGSDGVTRFYDDVTQSVLTAQNVG